MRATRIYSENGDFQRAEALCRSREKRQKLGEVFVEGVKAIELAVANAWQVETLLVSMDGPRSDWARGLVHRANARHLLELAPELMEKLSEKNDVSEVIALVRMPEDRLERIVPRVPALLVVLDRPTSPGNLGTIIRSCSSFGVDGVVVSGHASDIFDPKTIRASVGTIFTLPVVRVPSSATLEPWLQALRREHGVRVVGTSARASEEVAQLDLREPTVFLFGNETKGLSSHYRSLCDAFVTIPIAGAASSLNVACAAAVVLYEATRQRRSPSVASGSAN